MGVAQSIARFLGGGQTGNEGAPAPTEIVVHLPLGGEASPEDVADALCAAFPLGRVVRGVDLLTGAVELRFFYDVGVLNLVRNWLKESQSPHEISFLY